MPKLRISPGEARTRVIMGQIANKSMVLYGKRLTGKTYGWMFGVSAKTATRPVNFRKRYYRILAAAGIEKKGLHSLRHTFASSLVNGIKQADGSIKSLTPRQVADLLGHSTSQITELYYVKKDTSRLHGITDGFNL